MEQAYETYKKIIKYKQICEAEGQFISCWGYQDCAHIVTQKRKATKTDLRNGLSLCRGHHSLFHAKPQKFKEFIQNSWVKGYYEDVYAKSVKPTKVDWSERNNFLLDIFRGIQQGTLSIEEARELER